MEHKILVTGANGGIGGMILQHLLAKGHRNVIAQYRTDNENIKNIFKRFDIDPAKFSFKADLANEAELESMAAAIQQAHGFVGAVVNVAGASKNSMSWKTSKADFMEVLENNVLTAFLCSRQFIPAMRENKFGRIVNFSSVVGSTGVVGASAYCAAKAAIVGMTKSMSKELASKGITVNAVALGYFNAGLIDDVPQSMREEIIKAIPMQRFGEGKDIGALVSYLIGADSDYVTGQLLHLNGGQF